MDTRENIKKWLYRSILLMVLVQLTGCAEIYEGLYAQAQAVKTESAEAVVAAESVSAADESGITEPETVWNYYNPDGMTLTTRINTPEGYTRPEAEETSLACFLLNYPLKEYDAPVLLYNGELKEDQTAHAAVFSLPLEAEDFQQCADSIMRVYAEYYWSLGQQEKLSFHFTDEFTAEYTRWREGYRILFRDNQFSWIKSAEYDASYETFTQYMRMVFIYAGTYSMDAWESKPITLGELQIGDVFLKGDSPGHAMMVVDICYNELGEKAFLLAQGHMPAQEFQVAKNPNHPDDPWYYEDEVVYPFETIEYIFPEECLQRLTY